LVLVPAVEKLVRLLDFELMLDEAIHPQYVVVLSLKLELIADKKAELLLSLDLQLLQRFLENGVELFLYMGGFRINFFYLEVDFTEIISQLILPSFDVWINLFHL
jgi:hypothetical protein